MQRQEGSFLANTLQRFETLAFSTHPSRHGLGEALRTKTEFVSSRERGNRDEFFAALFIELAL
jgi:hypothetical protein